MLPEKQNKILGFFVNTENSVTSFDDSLKTVIVDGSEFTMAFLVYRTSSGDSFSLARYGNTDGNIFELSASEERYIWKSNSKFL